MYVSELALQSALRQLFGTAGHLLKIWFTLKQMGLTSEGRHVDINTSNSTPALEQLFSFGAPDRSFYVPFAQTKRFLTMKHDASRSIVQTTIQRWFSSGSVVTCDPTDFLSIHQKTDGKLRVNTTRSYPLGLGFGESGFAVKEGSRVSVPLTAFAIWYGKQLAIPTDRDPEEFLVDHLIRSLGITPSEQKVIFTQQSIIVDTQSTSLLDAEVYKVCLDFIDGKPELTTTVLNEDYNSYSRKVRSMITDIEKPVWLRNSPKQELQDTLDRGAKAILLYGPPRTGKTRAIDQLKKRTSPDRETIQIHDGWGYDNLIQGLKPDLKGNWSWEDGPLKTAIEGGKKFIVLDEINRTQITQSFGEVFSLIEDAYRGPDNAITLRNGASFYIPEDVVFIMTMNTVDKSTEEVDDALL
ncbi:MAG: AAA family ATPase, partial [Lentilitoribacter sp.]